LPFKKNQYIIVLRSIGLDQASDTAKIFEETSSKFFSQNSVSRSDCKKVIE